MNEEQRGSAYAAAAYVLWGCFPLYFPLLKPAGAFEILSHRVVWSLVFCLVVLLVRRKWAWVRELVHDRRRLGLLAIAATVIAINWGVYIWAVNADHVVDASLGYFINPLVMVLLGVVLLRERLRRAAVRGGRAGDPGRSRARRGLRPTADHRPRAGVLVRDIRLGEEGHRDAGAGVADE